MSSFIWLLILAGTCLCSPYQNFYNSNKLESIKSGGSEYAGQGISSFQEFNETPGWIFVLIVIIFIWYLVIVIVASIGTWQIATTYSHFDVSKSAKLPNPTCVTILRPLKGIDTEMEYCLESAFLQKYSNSNFEIIFCVEDEDDPAIEVIRELREKYPNVDSTLLIGNRTERYGPNPKINNLAKGYEMAKYDLLWVLDSNVWIAPGTLGRSVDVFDDNYKRRKHPIKLLHHLPLATSIVPFGRESLGSKLDEMYLLTSHCKFYKAINTVAIAPCIMGKSNMYERSELDEAVSTLSDPDAKVYGQKGKGLRFFARFIGEDHMISEVLWKTGGRTAMTTDSVIQPVGSLRLSAYFNRRVRWLRIRKYMVTVATLVEPTTESIVSGIMGSVSFSFLFLNGYWRWWYFLLHMTIWCISDYCQFNMLMSFYNVEKTMNPPYFLVKRFDANKRFENINSSNNEESYYGLRPLKYWLPTWLLREVLALPIWILSLFGGSSVLWRDKPFRINQDLSATPLEI